MSSLTSFKSFLKLPVRMIFLKGKLLPITFIFKTPQQHLPLEKHHLLCIAYKTLHDLASAYPLCYLCAIFIALLFAWNTLPHFVLKSFVIHRPTQRSLHFHKTTPFLFPLEMANGYSFPPFCVCKYY